jgi:ferrous iron transport protein B
MALLVLALGIVFQAIYAWSTPVMDLIDASFAALGGAVERVVPAGLWQSLLVDGILAAVGGVVVFLPQILLLALILALLEDCGYMARVAFLSDRLLGWLGLSGRAALPLLSGCACAVPAIMAARTIENRRERLATILVTPLMSCSARLPVYVLMVGAFVPERMLLGGWVSLRGLCLLGAHLIGVAVAVPVLLVLKKALLRGPAIPFVMELPPYRRPSALALLDRLQIQARTFLVRAGTVIAAIGIVVWALSYFPRPAAIHERFDAQRATAVDDAARLQLDREEAAAYLEQSVLGRLGHAIEPAVAPLGWDWRIGMGALASFPAREVVVATLATIFGVGEDDEGPGGVRGAIAGARRPDGSPLFTPAVGLSLVVFFALCCQCAATLAVIRRETGSWAWPAFVFGYMTALAYLAAWAAYRIGSALLA